MKSVLFLSLLACVSSTRCSLGNFLTIGFENCDFRLTKHIFPQVTEQLQVKFDGSMVKSLDLRDAEIFVHASSTISHFLFDPSSTKLSRLPPNSVLSNAKAGDKIAIVSSPSSICPSLFECSFPPFKGNFYTFLQFWSSIDEMSTDSILGILKNCEPLKVLVAEIVDGDGMEGRASISVPTTSQLQRFVPQFLSYLMNDRGFPELSDTQQRLVTDDEAGKPQELMCDLNDPVVELNNPVVELNNPVLELNNPVSVPNSAVFDSTTTGVGQLTQSWQAAKDTVVVNAPQSVPCTDSPPRPTESAQDTSQSCMSDLAPTFGSHSGPDPQSLTESESESETDGADNVDSFNQFGVAEDHPFADSEVGKNASPECLLSTSPKNTLKTPNPSRLKVSEIPTLKVHKLKGNIDVSENVYGFSDPITVNNSRTCKHSLVLRQTTESSDVYALSDHDQILGHLAWNIKEGETCGFAIWDPKKTLDKEPLIGNYQALLAIVKPNLTFDVYRKPATIPQLDAGSVLVILTTPDPKVTVLDWLIAIVRRAELRLSDVESMVNTRKFTRHHFAFVKTIAKHRKDFTQEPSKNIAMLENLDADLTEEHKTVGRLRHQNKQ